jgi:ATP-binding cassette subfamily C (CFTR/MRP) protein 1
MVFATYLAVPSGRSQAAWIKASEERVSATSRTLGSVKWLKISGLNDIAFKALQKLRIHELQVSRSYRLLLGASLVLRELLFPALRPPLAQFDSKVR